MTDNTRQPHSSLPRAQAGATPCRACPWHWAGLLLTVRGFMAA